MSPHTIPYRGEVDIKRLAGLQPKGLLTQVTGGLLCGHFTWGNLLKISLRLRIGLYLILTCDCRWKTHMPSSYTSLDNCGWVILQKWLCFAIAVVLPEYGLSSILLYNSKIYFKPILEYNTAAYTVSSHQLWCNTTEATINSFNSVKCPFLGKGDILGGLRFTQV